MEIHVVALLLLTSLAQAKEERGPVRARPPAREVLRVNVRIAGNAGNGGLGEIRTISLAQPAPPPLAGEDGEQHPAQRAVPFLNINTMVVERENFDRWLFADQRSQGERWRQMEASLSAKLWSAGREHVLTDQERAKLRLAGRGDIKRFFDQVEERRIDFEVERQSFRSGRAALVKLESLSLIYRNGAFGDGSLFAKTLRKINDDQKAGR